MRDAAAPAEFELPASLPEAAGLLLDRQLRLLDRLAELGLEIAEGLAAQARGTGPKVTEGDVPLAYARVSRAVRQAILLQSRLADESRAAALAADKARLEAREERREARKSRISFIMERVVEANHDDEDEVDRLVREADERIDDDGLIGDVLSRPASEIIADICRGLGLDPDWTRLAEEAWAKEEIGSGEAGWPLAQFQRVFAYERQRTGERARRAEGGLPPPLPVEKAFGSDTG